jgi:CheY-like chemotaxis protein
MQAKSFNGEKPTIWIEGRVENGASYLVVRDNGTGIESQHLDKIFDPFFTTKDVGEGMGLGLSICYRIVQESQGRISVRTEPGKFCEFTLEFRQRVHEMNAKQRAMQNLYDYNGSRSLSMTKRNPWTVHRALRTSFASHCRQHQHGLQRRGAQREIGLLMTDQRMPGEKGVWLLEKARQLRPRIIRILATAYSDMEAAVAAVNTGAIYKYVSKPWDPPLLESTLKRGGILHRPA